MVTVLLLLMDVAVPVAMDNVWFEPSVAGVKLPVAVVIVVDVAPSVEFDDVSLFPGNVEFSLLLLHCAIGARSPVQKVLNSRTTDATKSSTSLLTLAGAVHSKVTIVKLLSPVWLWWPIALAD